MDVSRTFLLICGREGRQHSWRNMFVDLRYRLQRQRELISQKWDQFKYTTPLCQWGRILESWFKYASTQYKSHNTNIKYNLNLDHETQSQEFRLLSTSVCWLTPNCVEGNFDFVKKEPSRTKTLVLQPFRLHLHTNLSLRLALTLKHISVSHRWHVFSIVRRLWSPFK